MRLQFSVYKTKTLSISQENVLNQFFFLESSRSSSRRESFQNFSDFYPEWIEQRVSPNSKIHPPFFYNYGSISSPSVGPFDLNVSSVHRTMVLAQGSQSSKRLPYLCTRQANYLSDVFCASRESTWQDAWDRNAIPTSFRHPIPSRDDVTALCPD